MRVRILIFGMLLKLCYGDVGTICTDLCTIPGFDICFGEECSMAADCTVTCTSDSTEPTTAVDNNANVTATPTLHPTCPYGYECFHGYCDSLNTDGTGIQCVCNDGWTAVDCNTPKGSECDSNCPQGSNCVLEFGKWKCTVPPITTSTVPTIRLETNDTRNKNVCSSDYVLPSVAEQGCTHGLQCFKGVCEETDGTANCECDPGAHGILCHNKCCLDCGEHGTCYYDNSNDTTFCNCIRPYTGDKCDKIIKPEPYQEEDTWYLWVVGVCVGVMVILIILGVVAPYLMWRHRVVMVMKIVHYFQKYEDDDDREWDAFVSYKSSNEDEKFVVQTLFPKLEKELGFRLHLHFRDFIPGETIANNIIRAVQGSRRSVMVISPQYIKSEFTRFEYQMAQQEMLKRKHRMIPILLEDISDSKETMDPNLKTILNSVTYLEWPKDGNLKKIDKFWKRLELSMPKKRNTSDVLQANANVPNGCNSTKLGDIKFSVVNEGDKTVNSHSMNGYTTINDAELQAMEDYDTINDDELDRTQDETSEGEQNKTGDNLAYTHNELKDDNETNMQNGKIENNEILGQNNRTNSDKANTENDNEEDTDAIIQTDTITENKTNGPKIQQDDYLNLLNCTRC